MPLKSLSLFSKKFPIPPKTLTLAATLIIGIILLSPFLSFQGFLSQGDHGRELTCFEAVSQGKIPYRDFFWNYGPLPLYYYAFCLKVFGTTINSVLAGRMLLNLLSGLLIFRSLALFVPLRYVFLGTIWFWFFNPDFHFTYCYTGGMTLFLAESYCLLSYIKNARRSYLVMALASVFLLCLVKINVGLAALIGLLGAVPLIDIWLSRSGCQAPKTFYLVAGLVLPVLVLLTYAAFLYTLPLHAMFQCFPYLPNPTTETKIPYTYSAAAGFRWWIAANFRNVVYSWKNAIMAFLIWSSVGLTGQWLASAGFQKSTKPSEKKTFVAAVGVLGILYFLSLHEFLKSGIPYRAAWGQPFIFLLIFLFLGTGLSRINKHVQTLLILSLLLLVVTTHLTYLRQLTVFKNSGKFFTSPRGELILANPPAWIHTVQETTNYLKQHLGADETFFSIPYEPLYYFLTGRRCPTWLYTFFTPYGHVLSVQEGQIIEDLSRRRVNYVLISNQQTSPESSLGMFGVNYGRLLARYIGQNFSEVAHFGDWDVPAGWVEGHAVKIFKRNHPL